MINNQKPLTEKRKEKKKGLECLSTTWYREKTKKQWGRERRDYFKSALCQLSENAL